jgi:carbon monoxide dehydrogenase subunit G
MAELTLSVDVAASAEQTWAALVDWDRQGEWMLGTQVVGEQADRVGGRLRARTGFGPLGITDTMTITAWEPPYRCDVEHTGRVVRGTGTFAVEDRPGGSRFVWSERLDLPLGAVGRAGWPLVRPAFAAGVRLSLRRFARFAAAY